MKTRFLTAVLVLSMYGPLSAGTDFAPGESAIAQLLAGQSEALSIPVPQNPSPDGQGSGIPSGSNGDVNVAAIWQKPPQVVCKLTGVGSFNESGTGSQVKGVDLGSMFEHKEKMYFVFGDTNINDATPSNHLSNVLAYTSDKDASDCVSLHYISMRDVFPSVADFYAKESDLQAKEEEKESYDIDPGIVDDYQTHYTWASAASVSAAEALLLQKAAKIFDYYAVIKKSRPDLADYYARLSVRLSNFGVSFADDITQTSSRHSPNYQPHYDWALTASAEDLNLETKIRYDKLFAAIDQDRVKQMIASKTFPSEYTDIPTYGVSVNGRIYVYIMSIRSWNPWSSNFAALAYSDDDGKTFIRIDDFFPANSNFMQVALVKKDGYLYLFGIPSGRNGGVKLARVPEGKIPDKGAYKFYRQSGAGPSWVDNEFDGSIIVPGQVGELAVQWNPFLNAWLMTSLNEGRRWFEARTSASLEGPWGPADFLAGSQEFSSVGGWGYYGPFIHPTYTENNGETLYFLASLWSHYNVFVLKTPLRKPTEKVQPAAVPGKPAISASIAG
jgi:hypothetical protein